MTHFDMHDAIDRLDAGLPGQPRLDAIVAGGRKRRRRTRTLWAAAGLATVAGVAQVSFLAGAHQAPATTGAASAPASPAAVPAPLGDLTAQTDAVVSAALPGVSVPDRKPASVLTSYRGDGQDISVSIGRGADARFMGPKSCEVEQGCTQIQVGDLIVKVSDHWDETFWARDVFVSPGEGVDGPAWTVIVSGGGNSAQTPTDQAEADATLPSVQTLTDLAVELARLPLQ